MMMSSESAIILGLLAPLAVALLTPFLAVRAAWRDVAGPVGAVITLFAAIHVAIDVLAGNVPTLVIANFAEGISMTFAVTPLGAIFGLVASGLWIMAAIFQLAICAVIMKNSKRVLPLFMLLRCMRQWRSPGQVICWCCLFSMRY